MRLAILSDLSRIAHDVLFPGPSQSLCARAWQHRQASSFWAIWVRVFTARHCEASHRYYRRRNAADTLVSHRPPDDLHGR